MDLRPKCPIKISELQRKLGLKSYATLVSVLAGRVRCSGPLAIRIEKATKGAIAKGGLRPDLWPHRKKVVIDE